MIEQVEGSNLVKLNYKYTTRKGPSISSVLLIFFAVVVVFGAVVVGSFLNNYIDNLQPVDLAVADSEDHTLNTAYWNITEVKQNADTPNTYDLNLESSIGNLRSYTGIRSFGLSNAGNKLATIKGDNFEIIDLAADTVATAPLPFSVGGDKAEVISWSFDDKYFALSTFNLTDNTTHILILSAVGEIHQDIKAQLAYKSFGGENVPYPVYFSPHNYYVLARTFEQDNNVAKVSQKPVTLAIYKVDGRSIWEETVRGSVTDESELIYSWNSTGKQVAYAIVQADKPVNYANKHLFTQLKVDIGD